MCNAWAVICLYPTGTRATTAVPAGWSGADEGEDFVALGFHLGPGCGALEVEADERLGVGATDVEPPGGIFHAHAIEFEDVPVGVFGLQFGQDFLGVAGDLGVDFAGAPVFAQGRDELGE